jgi:methionyl aminopeptidase
MDSDKIIIKTQEQVEIMKKSGEILAEVLFALVDQIKIGMSEIELDLLAEKMIRERGGEPGFMKVPGYHNTVCMMTNDVVVHGIPTDYRFKSGDIVGIDCGVYYKGFHTDMAETVRLGDSTDAKKDEEADTFLATGKRALENAIAQAKIGNRVGHISKAFNDVIEKEGGYSVVRNLVGHGVGRDLHEAPEIPGYLPEPIDKTPLLKENMTLALEIIYNKGTRQVQYDDDGWTIRTKDGEISAVFERSLVVTKDGPVVLTK